MKDARFRAIVFDFDGVILESATIKTDAFGAVFADHPKEIVAAIREHHLANMGISRFEKFKWAYQELLQQPLSDAQMTLLSQKFSDYVDDRVRTCAFVPGALDSLRTLHGKLPLFVASGTPHDDLVATIKDRDLSIYFEQVWGSPRKKPDSLREVLATVGIDDPKQLLMIGDGESDYRAARNVGASFYARQTDEFPGDWKSLGQTSHADLTSLTEMISRS